MWTTIFLWQKAIIFEKANDMELSLKTLDEILLNRMIEIVRKTKQRKIDLNLEDLLEKGYTENDIMENMERIQKIDGRVLVSESQHQSDLVN